VTEFILLGLTSAPELQVAFFIMITLIYLINVVGNLGMIILILLDSRLHTPMYFFLGNLSLADFCYSSAVTPTVMAFLFGAFGSMENLFLAAMAYDRYVAVCKPLHYTTTMTTRVCACLAAGCYLGGFLNVSIHVGETLSVFFCKSNVAHHFFCDIPAVMALSCSDKHVNEMVLIIFLLVILVSYMFIFITILRMLSATGYQKVLSTCASHLTAVSIFCGTVIFMYLQPSSSHSMDTDKFASVFYYGHPHAEPCGLQPQEQGGQECFQKVIG
ncbi:OR5B3-like, partial [Ictidomys tridecemlineatus]|uniref:G-protein coupled receptors family 1 profile domain-containing protein n=1 Tax=Ictidomys tridecemlineatus TaxID=43179 RepID=A0A287D3J2_ICTTR